MPQALGADASPAKETDGVTAKIATASTAIVRPIRMARLLTLNEADLMVAANMIGSPYVNELYSNDAVSMHGGVQQSAYQAKSGSTANIVRLCEGGNEMEADVNQTAESRDLD